jgi:hypothetical protein
MIFHACRADGASIGQFEGADFREKIHRGELQPDHYYWREGMADWKPISEYRPPGRVTKILGSIPTRRSEDGCLVEVAKYTAEKAKKVVRRG